MKILDVEEHCGNSFIDFRFAKLSQQAAERLRLATENSAKRIVRNVIGHRAGNPQYQYAVGLNRGALSANSGNNDCYSEHHDHYQAEKNAGNDDHYFTSG